MFNSKFIKIDEYILNVSDITSIKFISEEEGSFILIKRFSDSGMNQSLKLPMSKVAFNKLLEQLNS